MPYWTEQGSRVSAISAEQMMMVDRIAMNDFGLDILQMMENAGRNLAEIALNMLGTVRGEVVILAGGGGNGGGGVCCARHLHNRGVRTEVVFDRDLAALKGAAGAQWRILQAAGLEPLMSDRVVALLERADLVIDALIGYSLRGTPRGRTAELIALCNDRARRVLALDVPSGLDATTGEVPGVMIRAEHIVTLALPKMGLRDTDGAIFLADIGIPPEVYTRLGVCSVPTFGSRYWLRLARTAPLGIEPEQLR